MRDWISYVALFTALVLGCGPAADATTPDAVVDVTPGATADASGTSAAAEASGTAAVAQPTATSSAAPTASATATAPTATASATATSTPSTGMAILNNDRIEVSSPITFEAGSARLRAESNQGIAEVSALLRQRAEITLMRVEVHTDSDGDDKANLKLSDDRAMAIAKAIVANHVECKRVIAVGFGESKPLAPNDSPQNKAKNRRITLVVAALRNKPIGGRPVDGSGHVAGDPCH